VSKLLKRLDVTRPQPPALLETMSLADRQALWRELGARRLAAG